MKLTDAVSERPRHVHFQPGYHMHHGITRVHPRVLQACFTSLLSLRGLTTGTVNIAPAPILRLAEGFSGKLVLPLLALALHAPENFVLEKSIDFWQSLAQIIHIL